MKKILSLIFGLGLTLGVFAQTTPTYAPYNSSLAAPVYSTAATGLPMSKKFFNAGKGFFVDSDTVTNTGTNYLITRTPIGGYASTVSITWTATKQTGTVAGTVTLYGSVDGVNFVAITGNLGLNQTSIATFTPTDVATQTKTWVLQNNPYSWYEVSWTGAGTMAATQTARLQAH